MEDKQLLELEEALSTASKGGDDQAKRLLSLLYDDLRRIARGMMRRENAGQTIQATALVHEAYMKLVRCSKGWESEAHFMNAAALKMREIMLDRRKHKKSLVDGGGHKRTPIDLIDPPAKSQADPLDLIALDAALSALELHNARKAQVVSLKFFAGLNESQISEIIGINARQVRRDWSYAKLWMARHIDGNAGCLKANDSAKMGEV